MNQSIFTYIIKAINVLNKQAVPNRTHHLANLFYQLMNNVYSFGF